MAYLPFIIIIKYLTISYLHGQTFLPRNLHVAFSFHPQEISHVEAIYFLTKRISLA